MKLLERIYNVNGLRPKPIVLFDQNIGFGSIAFSWGRSEDARRAQEIILNYVNSSLADIEVTSPFEFQLDLSKEANALRVGTLLANDDIYRQSNKMEWQSGLEIINFIIKKNQISWAQVGAPSLQLIQKNGQIIPLSVAFDFSKSSSNSTNSILPIHLLGVERNCRLDCGEFYFEKTAKICFSTEHLSRVSGEIRLEELSRQLIETKPQQSHWISLLEDGE